MRRPMHLLAGVAALLAIPRMAVAQPAPSPLVPAPPPLAELKDDRQLSETLAAITSDPAIQVNDPGLRALAQALMIEGVKQLRARAFDQALANFLDAYAKFPSPRILLNVASTLRDMGRLADAANTYQRYLLDPATGAERVGEVKQLLLDLDGELTILTVRVVPRGSDVSIDGGPFLAVGSSLLTRVRPGLHLVRIRKGDDSTEITVNGFEGENKEVAAVLKVEVPPPEPQVVVAAPPQVRGTQAAMPAAPPEHVEAWLTTGTQYGSDGSGRVRKVRAGFAGPEIAAVVPAFSIAEDGVVELAEPPDRITSGVIGVVRIDGQLRGAAGGIGLAIARGRLEADVMFLRSAQYGGYVGLRYRLLTGLFRPYVAAGMPGFVYDAMTDGGEVASKLAIGVRAAGGLELVINGHLSVQADLGYEHFFGVTGTGFESDVMVPTVGVIGRL